MSLTADQVVSTEPVLVLRRLRTVQSWTLMAVAALSIVAGAALLRRHDNDTLKAFLNGVGWQFLVWGAIDAIFAAIGIFFSARTASRPITLQAEADEFVAAEKLLRSLQFNHRLNIVYVGTAGLLIAWGAVLHSSTLAGHGVGVLIQGGFLLVFDLVYIVRYAKLMTTL